MTVGVQNSIYQQRANDSVQNFIEFLRSAYAEVADVQNTVGGRSEQAVYGKLITFGETHNLAGEELGEGNRNNIFIYTVVGDIDKNKSGGALKLLKDLNANVTRKTMESGVQKVVLAGIAERYQPRWAATIEPSCGDKAVSECSFDLMEGMVLIVRHPNSGEVYTYYSPKVAQVNKIVSNAQASGLDVNPFDLAGGASYLTNGDFKMQQVDLRINPTGAKNVYNRTDVMIINGAKNASGVELVPSDGEDYKCGK